MCHCLFFRCVTVIAQPLRLCTGADLKAILWDYTPDRSGAALVCLFELTVEKQVGKTRIITVRRFLAITAKVTRIVPAAVVYSERNEGQVTGQNRK
jgi:hypothetical protein